MSMRLLPGPHPRGGRSHRVRLPSLWGDEHQGSPDVDTNLAQRAAQSQFATVSLRQLRWAAEDEVASPWGGRQQACWWAHVGAPPTCFPLSWPIPHPGGVCWRGLPPPLGRRGPGFIWSTRWRHWGSHVNHCIWLVWLGLQSGGGFSRVASQWGFPINFGLSTSRQKLTLWGNTFFLKILKPYWITLLRCNSLWRSSMRIWEWHRPLYNASLGAISSEYFSFIQHVRSFSPWIHRRISGIYCRICVLLVLTSGSSSLAAVVPWAFKDQPPFFPKYTRRNRRWTSTPQHGRGRRCMGICKSSPCGGSGGRPPLPGIAQG